MELVLLPIGCQCSIDPEQLGQFTKRHHLWDCTMSIELELELELFCEVCKEPLTGEANFGRYGKVEVSVEPCENCMSDKHKEGYEEGLYEN